MAGNDRKRPIKPKEAELWEKAMEGAKKSDRPKNAAPIVRPKPVGDAFYARQRAAEKLDAPDLVNPRNDDLTPRPVGPAPVRKKTPDKQAGLGTGLDRKNAERLRKGKIDIDGTIDLHGMRQTEAYSALHQFIRSYHGRGARCVLVITGKGKGRDFRGMPRAVADTPWERKSGTERFEMPTGSGVLRELVPGWLNEAGLRPFVVTHSNAQPKHGGSGALYVYLRRTRDR
ncbi:MAG: Smr/MutS family protein [Alphaproteobacteria bacterium]